MLLLLICWIVLLAAALPLGAACLSLCGFSELEAAEDRFLAQAWIGLFALSNLLLALSFWTPLAPAATLPAIIAAPALCLLLPSVRQGLSAAALPRPGRNSFFAILLAAAFNASGPAMLYDTGLYHYPLLRWLAEAGTVPGMALIHFRFGFSSPWLATAAAADFGPWAGHTAGVTGGLAFALLVFQFALVLQRVCRNAASATDRFLLYGFPLFFVFLLIQRQQASPSPNLPAAAGILLTAWLLMQGRSSNTAVVMAAGAVSMKLVAAPALGIALFARLLNRRKEPGNAVLPIALAGILMVPLVYANYVASGCPLFPSAIACVATPASVGGTRAAEITLETLNWARYVGFGTRGAVFTTVDWIPGWPLHLWNAVFLVAVLLGLSSLGRFRGFVWPWTLAALGCLFVFAAAPDLRFGIGYASVFVGLFGLAWLRDPPLVSRANPRFWVAAAVGVLVCDAAIHEALYYSILHVPEAAPRLSRLLLPPPVPQIAVARDQVNGIAYWKPAQADQCWGAARVCTPYPPVPTLHLCDGGLGEAGGYCK